MYGLCRKCLICQGVVAALGDLDNSSMRFDHRYNIGCLSDEPMITRVFVLITCLCSPFVHGLIWTVAHQSLGHSDHSSNVLGGSTGFDCSRNEERCVKHV